MPGIIQVAETNGQEDEASLGRVGYHNGYWVPTTKFIYPSVNVAEALKGLFGAEIEEADLQWLANLVGLLLKFENGALIEAFCDRPPNPHDYRLAATRLLKVLHAIDDVMIHSRQPDRDWRQIALALDLPSRRYFQLTEKVISQRFGITPMAISKSISKLLQLAELNPHGRGFNGMLH